MNTQTFKIKLYEILKKDGRLFDEGSLNQTLLFDLIDKVDEDIIGLLLENKDTQEKFFTKIKDVFVFKSNDFKFFIDENKIFNSYTQYKNRIGLNDGKEFINDRTEVVLNFPFKDCVLEGGQTTEEGEDYYFEWEDEKLKDKLDENGNKIKDGRKNVKEVDIPAHYEMKKSKRKEIFFNEILAKDEIDRLFDPKALVNWKRYTKNGEEKIDKIKRDENGNIKENLLIKGNNLLALHSLKSEFIGKIKLIYIDPPYNTGNDDFKYNDKFNHSTWLTFMKNRLEVAHSLLKSTGSIYISIDDNELGYMSLLLDEIFGKENRTDLITVKRGSATGHKAINPGVVNISDYLIGYAKDKNLWEFNRLFKGRDRNIRYNNYILNRNGDMRDWKFCSLLDAFSQHTKIAKTQLKKELGTNFEKKMFEFVKLNSDAVIQFAYPDESKVSIETKELISESKKNPTQVYRLKREDELDIYLYNGQRLLFYSDRLMNIDGEIITVEPMSNIWDDVLPNDLHNEGGVKLKKGKKPEKLLRRIIELNTNKNDIVLDFHLGSGTTSAVSHKINRQYIGIEQMNYIEDLAVKRLNYVVSGENKGISKAVNWKGGGDFIYVELAKWNEVAKENINNATSLQELENLFDEMYEKYFLNYNLKIKEFKEKVIKEKEFKNLSLEEQKRMFLTMLDLNQMYISASEIEDKKYSISKEDQKLTKMFYGEI